MLDHSTWSRPVHEWVNIPLAPHRADYPMMKTFPHGVPVGGLGAGNIGVSPDGRWNCIHLDPGRHCMLGDMQDMGLLFSYEVDRIEYDITYNDAVYTSLYPQAQWTFDWGHYSHLKCIQYSPIIFNEYHYSSFPTGCFKIMIDNHETYPVNFKIELNLYDILGRVYERIDEGNTFHYELQAPQSAWDIDEHPNEIIFSKQVDEGVHEQFGVRCSEFMSLSSHRSDHATIQISVELDANVNRVIDLNIAWDIPHYIFPDKVSMNKKYTEFFSTSGHHVHDILDVMFHKRNWLYDQINNAQKVFWDTHPYSSYIKTLMLNELYYISYGGTLWEAQTNRFAYLESIDYPFYETLDVRFYSSWALLYGWPDLEKQVMHQFADVIAYEDTTPIRFNETFLAHQSVASDKPDNSPADYCHGIRKVSGACPHDLGSFEEKPFDRINAYTYQNSNLWKDLNTKFVLLIYRDYYFTKDVDFLYQCWPSIKTALDYMTRFDTDKDGLPENGGWPDQTYDNWTMVGSSAYCSILYIAALIAFKHMSILVNDLAMDVDERIQQAVSSLEEKLWNGQYYNYDETLSDVMSDQMAGQWFLRMCGLPIFIEPERERSVLKLIYKRNFSDFQGNQYGMVNGRTALGDDVFTDQGNDCWIGINYALASYYLLIGEEEKSKALLNAMYISLFKNGYAFRTPESIDGKGNYIAQMYMRPQAIWALAFLNM